ncbi:hypothetical protein AAULR_25956, partial [Lacticaseibacillus rhamnosus MTCC 5462]
EVKDNKSHQMYFQAKVVVSEFVALLDTTTTQQGNNNRDNHCNRNA